METSDEDLVRAAVQGDAQAFQILINRHYDLIFRLAFKTFGNRADAEDLAQDIELRPVFRTVCLLTLRGHFPSHIFESLFWRFVADA